MNKEIYDILYNPSSVSSCYENPAAEDHPGEATHDLSTKQNLYLKLLDQLALVRDEELAKGAVLALYREVLLGVPPDLRAFILNGFNTSLKRFEVRFAKSKALFDQCLQLIIEMKAQIDREDNLQGMMTPAEWVELEKSICHLTRWENVCKPKATEEDAQPLSINLV
jgi:hypothetical protein